MTALTADRSTPKRSGENFSYPMAASTEIFMGGLTVLDASGNAEPGSTATGKIAVGRSNEYKNNTGAAAAVNVEIEAGVFHWANSGSDPVTKANIGDTVYIEDDQTVCATATGKSAAGVMVDIDDTGVWVETKPPVALVSGLTAANNLSDVGSASTSRSNLGLADGTADLDLNDVEMDTATITETLDVAGLAGLDGGYDLGTNSPVRKFKRTSLSAAQIQTLNATPVQLVAAVAGKVHVPVMAIYSYTHVANAYDDVGAGEDFRIQWQTGTVQAMPDLDTTSDINLGGTSSDVCVIHADNAVKQKPVTNDDLEVTILSGEIYSAAGDGTMVIDLIYDEYTV